LQCGAPARIDVIHIGAVRDEHRNHIESAEQRRKRQRRFSRIVGLVEVAMRVEQLRGNLRFAFEKRPHQSGITVPVGSASIGARSEEGVQGFRVIVVRAEDQRGIALRRRCLERKVGIDQRLNDIRASGTRRGKPVFGVTRRVRQGRIRSRLVHMLRATRC